MRFFFILYPLALELKFETGLYWDAILTSFLCEGKSLGIAETKSKHPKSVRRVVGNCFRSHQDAFGNPGHLHNLVTSKPEEGWFGQPKYCCSNILRCVSLAVVFGLLVV